MGRKLKTAIGLAIGTVAAWACAVRPRIFDKPDLSEIRRFDYARGGWFDRKKQIPENSLPAFRAAVEHGYGIRLDVRLCRDGEPVVFRDSRLFRMCGADGTVENSTLEELREMQLDGTENGIPTLEEALGEIDAQVPVILCLHSEEDNYNSLASQACAACDCYDGVFTVEADDPRVLRWFRKNRREYIRGTVIDGRHTSGNDLMHLLWDFCCFSMLLNFLTEPDYVSVSLDSRINPSLWICRLFYRIQRMDWTVRTLEEYEAVRTAGSIAVFEEIEP